MNKKVQTYLETKENHAINFETLKNGATKVVSAGLTTAALIALLAGCNAQKTPKETTDEPTITTNQVITGDPNSTTESPVTTEPVIENVTAEEVLDKLGNVLNSYMLKTFNITDADTHFDSITNNIW